MNVQWDNAESRPRRTNSLRVVLMLSVIAFSLLALDLTRPLCRPVCRLPRVKSAKVMLSNFETTLDTFEIAVGRYPTTAEGLRVLVEKPVNNPGNWQKPFMKNIPLDPWGNEYQYVYPGTHNKDSYDLSSLGPDGKLGGGDDIVNWEEPMKP
jgi:general secretion pathway protein G